MSSSTHAPTTTPSIHPSLPSPTPTLPSRPPPIPRSTRQLPCQSLESDTTVYRKEDTCVYASVAALYAQSCRRQKKKRRLNYSAKGLLSAVISTPTVGGPRAKVLIKLSGCRSLEELWLAPPRLDTQSSRSPWGPVTSVGLSSCFPFPSLSLSFSAIPLSLSLSSLCMACPILCLSYSVLLDWTHRVRGVLGGQ